MGCEIIMEYLLARHMVRARAMHQLVAYQGKSAFSLQRFSASTIPLPYLPRSPLTFRILVLKVRERKKRSQ